MTSDVLNINGDVTGITKLIVHATSNEDIRGMGEILFAESFNDTVGSAGSFSLFRVYGSPYLYDIIYADLGSDSRTWSFAMNDDSNPDYQGGGGGIDVSSEVVGYIGLHEAAVEQTRSMVSNIRNKIADNKVYCKGCGLYDVAYDNKPLSNVWVSPVYHTASIDKPQDMDASIYGLEGGFDVQYDAHHKLGVFASYRRGNYDLSGKGETYHSPIKSEIDINSYIGGLYYRYDKNNFWAFGTIYGGLQQADLSTKDGVDTSTDGSQFGGEIDLGYLFPLKDNYTLEPNIGVSYTSIDFDKIVDKYGKTAEYDTIGYLEAKAGIKLEKVLHLSNGPAKVYVEPSIIQAITNGDSVQITGIDEAIDTYEEGTLGRIELGGRYAIDKQLSIFGRTNYTFGSSYDALSFTAGLNYTW
jgi:outer membrane autotransporter protein